MIRDEDWTYSNWTAAELDKKSVEYQFPSDSGIVFGIGEFMIYGTAKRLVVIVRRETPLTLQNDKGVIREYTLTQPIVDQIERHPGPAVAEFRCFHGVWSREPQ